MPLKGLLSKPLHTIENLKLRDMVAELLEYQIEAQYIKESENVFPDHLSRNTLDELYSYPQFEERDGDYLVFLDLTCKVFSCTFFNKHSLKFTLVHYKDAMLLRQ